MYIRRHVSECASGRQDSGYMSNKAGGGHVHLCDLFLHIFNLKCACSYNNAQKFAEWIFKLDYELMLTVILSF